ncbi:MAG: ABC transporter ATP-binding protein [Candidatus Sericytochromatia bacterium]
MENKNIKPEKALKTNKKYKLTDLLKPYISLLFFLILLSFISNSITLSLPKIISNTIDNFSTQDGLMKNTLNTFISLSILIFIISYLQGILQAYISEKVAKDLRNDLINKISYQSYLFVQDITPSKLLTRLTLDIDNIKLFISQAIPSLVSSVVLIIGSSILLLMTNWKLAIPVLLIIPTIIFIFFRTMKKVRILFKRTSEIIDKINKTINENIVGSTLVRVLNSQDYEYKKFLELSSESKSNGVKIVSNFALLIPSIIFISNIATLVIFLIGGNFVIQDKMTLGDFSAFNGYLAILFFPILLIGFMSNTITQASMSHSRIAEALEKTKENEKGSVNKDLQGNISVQNLSLKIQDKNVLKDINFEIKALSKTAIIGPTGAGKTQLLYLLTGLINPTEGIIKYDNENLKDYDKDCLYNQIGLVFQDNIMFNTTIRDNICFNKDIKEEDLIKAIKTAELYDFIESLPQKLDTLISERGTSLSGGQKQRLMLARVLVLNPLVLFLDDFTARVDYITEKKILENLKTNYPNITLISITQNIEPIKNYDQIILLMEGELIDKGKHEDLIKRSIEYIQIYDSQRSTNEYELHTN